MKSLIWIVAIVVSYSSASTAKSCQTNLVSLYRLYCPNSGDHFYTTSVAEANNAAATLGYNREGSSGLVATKSLDCQCGQNFKPVFRLFKPGTKDDHFYTLNVAEANNAVERLGYRHEGIAYYCVEKLGECGASLALYRYLRTTDHFYTTSLSEGKQSGGKYEGIICYIWPAK